MKYIISHVTKQDVSQQIDEVQSKRSFSLSVLQSSIGRFLLQADITHTSRTTYRRSLSRFVSWCKERFINSLDALPLYRETLLEYKQYLDEKNLKPFTRSLYLVAIRQFFTWTETILLYPNIAKGLRGIKRLTKTHHKDSLTRDQVVTLLNTINRKDLLGARDYAMIYLLVHTGLRLIEIAGIAISDIEIQNDTTDALLWVRGKGRDGKDAFVVLVSETLGVIHSYIKKRKEYEELNPDSILFVVHGPFKDIKKNKKLSNTSLSRIIRKRMISAGIKNKRISAHSLRHTFGVMAIQAGASLYEVQLAMRHSSSNTTQVYLGDIEQIKRRQAAPEKLVRSILDI
jgi:integrase/recombinase XerD